MKIILLQMFVKPGQAALLVHGGTLINTPAIGDHHRCYQTTILGAPPTAGPITAALFFKRTVTQESHQALTGERHVHVLQLSKTQVATFNQTARRVWIDMTA